MPEAKNANKPVRSVLISQPAPAELKRSPYNTLVDKYGLQVDYRAFIHVEGVEAKDIRKQKLDLLDYTAIILTSRNAIDHFFRVCKALRIEMPADTKYFCLSKAVADYLRKHIVYRKRKVFVGKRHIEDLKTPLLKYKNKERFLLPCSNLGSKPVVQFLEAEAIPFQEIEMFRTVSSDLSDLKDITYDVLAFFSPLGIQSLFENFPDFQQNDTRIATFGNSTRAAAEAQHLVVNIQAPRPQTPSMSMAIQAYMQGLS